VASAADLLRDQWGRSCERLLARLDGLTDDEYRWEPVAGCWNVRPCVQSPSGWSVDYPEVPPDPPPFTTIAWRMLHVSDGNSIYWEHSFGPGVRNSGTWHPEAKLALRSSISSKASDPSPRPSPRWMTAGWTRRGPHTSEFSGPLTGCSPS
jgi:DinB superfamily